MASSHPPLGLGEAAKGSPGARVAPLLGPPVEVLDTTLRDGAQAEHVSFSLEDKLEIARALDRLGVDYLEGGWPSSNPKDLAFFRRAARETWRRARIVAFGSTRHRRHTAKDDPNLRALLESGAPAISVFGKTWDFHVRRALRVTLAENLEMIRGSIAFLAERAKEVLFDAEHFFDGYAANPEYGLRALEAAARGGAKLLVLCDTNGGRLPEEVAKAAAEVRKRFAPLRLGIHAHNDSGLAVANTLAAVQAGCGHVQGTMNGFGERCGTADLTAVIANLQLKLRRQCLRGADSLRMLTAASRLVYEIANLPLRDHQPFVGRSAFAHKGGAHVSAVNRDARTYEHAPPESVGNSRRVLISELSGRSNLVARQSERFGLKNRPEALKKVLDRLMQLENEGYVFEGAEASFELLVRKALERHAPFFRLHGFRTVSDVRERGGSVSEATVKVEVGGRVEHTAAEGNGPVDALNGALRKALEKFYPELREVSLMDYKVRVINPKAATAAKVLVSITCSDRRNLWTTVGVSGNVIDASYHALVDAVEYKLYRTRGEERPGTRKRRG